MVISDRGTISFSSDGSKVFLNVAPPPEPEKDTNAEAADTTVAIGKLNFVGAIRIAHYHGADLPAAQKQSPATFEVLRRHILQQCDHVVHFHFTKHA